ncbi:MAG: hypothetical protein V4577_07570 [Bacteroidota bacterium]
MTTRRIIRPFVYPLIIVLCLLISIGLLYINFSDFVMPYVLVIGLLILCAIVSVAGLIGFIRQPPPNDEISAKVGRLLLLIALTIVVIVSVAIPILVIQNA